MTSDALPSPPRKASWKRWTLAVAGVVVIIAIALFLKAPTPERVKIWYVYSTNYFDDKYLVFQGTNGTTVEVIFRVRTTTNMTASSHPRIPLTFYHDQIIRIVEAGRVVVLSEATCSSALVES